MKKIICLLVFLCLHINGFTQWHVFEVSTLIPNEGSLLVAPAFIDANTGCVGGSDGIRRTTDAGQTWKLVYPSYFVTDISFADKYVGYAIPRCFPQRCGEIVKTTDAGLTWYRCYVSIDTVYFSKIYVKNRDEVYAAISTYLSPLPPRLYKTTDAGQTWDEILKVREELRTFALDNNDDMYVVVGGDYFTSSVLQFSSNGGTSWDIIDHPAGVIFGVKCIFNRLYIWINSCLYFSDNRGETWELSYWFPGGYRDLLFVDNKKGYVISSTNTAIVYETCDGGLSWNQVYNLEHWTELRGISSTDRSIYFVGRNINVPIGIVLRYDFTTQGTDPLIGIPKSFQLNQNFPNPFNPVTKINYSLPKNSLVKIIVYDITGKEVCTLVNKNQNAGNYAVDFDGSKLTSGVYFYKLIAGDFTATKKMMLIK